MTDNPIKLPVSSYLKSFTLSSKSDGDYVLTNMESFTFVKHSFLLNSSVLKLF